MRRELMRPLMLLMFFPVSRSSFLQWLLRSDYPTLIKYHRWWQRLRLLLKVMAQVLPLLNCFKLLQVCSVACTPNITVDGRWHAFSVFSDITRSIMLSSAHLHQMSWRWSLLQRTDVETIGVHVHAWDCRWLSWCTIYAMFAHGGLYMIAWGGDQTLSAHIGLHDPVSMLVQNDIMDTMIGVWNVVQWLAAAACHGPCICRQRHVFRIYS